MLICTATTYMAPVSGQTGHLFQSKPCDKIKFRPCLVIIFTCLCLRIGLKIIPWCYLGSFCLGAHLGDISKIVLRNTASETKQLFLFIYVGLYLQEEGDVATILHCQLRQPSL